MASVKKMYLCSSLSHDDTGLYDPHVCVVTVELCAIVNKRFGTHEYKKYVLSSCPVNATSAIRYSCCGACSRPVLCGSASGCRYIPSSVLWGNILSCHAPRTRKGVFFPDLQLFRCSELLLLPLAGLRVRIPLCFFFSLPFFRFSMNLPTTTPFFIPCPYDVFVGVLHFFSFGENVCDADVQKNKKQLTSFDAGVGPVPLPWCASRDSLCLAEVGEGGI